MSDGYAHRRQSAGRAGHKLTPVRHRSLPVPVSATDSQGWRGPTLSDLESEGVAACAATRSSLLLALLGSLPAFHEEQPKGRAALTIGSQTARATRGSRELPPHYQ